MRVLSFMKRFLTYLTLLAACLTAVAANFADETLHYKVMFKWGLINKQAGTVAINLTNTPDQYVGRLLSLIHI